MTLHLSDLDDLFKHHAPNDITAPKYAAIRNAEHECAVDSYAYSYAEAPGPQWQAFAKVIIETCPANATRDRAVDFVVLAKNAMSEAIAVRKSGASDSGSTARIIYDGAQVYLRQARWKANEAIALHKPWQENAKLPEEDRALWGKVVGLVEATSFEYHTLWEQYGTGVPGTNPSVARMAWAVCGAEMPTAARIGQTTLELRFRELGPHRKLVVFWDPVSVRVDYEQIDEWLAARVPWWADERARRKVDAGHFNHLFSMLETP